MEDPCHSRSFVHIRAGVPSRSRRRRAVCCTPGADGSQSVRATRPGRAVGRRCDRPRKPDHIGPAPAPRRCPRAASLFAGIGPASGQWRVRGRTARTGPAVPVPGSPGKLWRGCERWPCRSDFQGGTLSGACAAGGSGGHRLRQAGGLAACPAGSSFLRSHGHSRRRGRHRARNSARSGGAHDPPGLASAPATKQNGTSTSPEVSIGRSVTAGSATPYTAPVDVNPSNCRRLMHSCTAGLCVARFGRSPPATCR